MIVTLSVMAAGVAVMGLGVLAARSVPAKDWAADRDAHILIQREGGGGVGELMVVDDGQALFKAPAVLTAIPEVAIAAGNPSRNPSRPGGDAPPGRYKVLQGVDLSSASEPIRRAMGPMALLLQSEKGQKGVRDIAIHCGEFDSQGHRSVGGVWIDTADMERLLGFIGNTPGFKVVIR